MIIWKPGFRWLFTRVCKILVYQWFELNSGIPSQSKFDSTNDFPFSVVNLGYIKLFLLDFC